MTTTPQPPIDWTDEPPTEEGYYWTRWRDGPMLMRVMQIHRINGSLCIANYGFSRLRDYDGLVQWWPVPIQPPSQPEACVWTQDEDGAWWACGSNGFSMTTGTASDNRMMFCCFCGKPIEERPYRDPRRQQPPSQPSGDSG